jgi:hypothetical protein
VSRGIVDVLQDRSRPWDGIHLAHCTGKVDVVISNVLQLESVQKLSLLPNGHHINDKCLYALANGLKVNKSVKGLVLRVDLYQELSSALAEGLNANSALEELSLILSTSDTNAITTLARGIQGNSKLKSLMLNRCSLEDGQIAALVSALENHPSLRELSVQGSSCRAKGIVAISGLLQSANTKPFKLDLSKQDFKRNEMFGISFLAPALLENRSMRFLDLSSNNLTDIDVACIASALSENSALEELKLVNCSITNRGAKIIANKLPRMTGLKGLWLHDNPFDKDGALYLLEAMRTNMHMEQLILPRGRENSLDDIQREIEYYSMLNRGGRRLLRSQNNIPLGLWPRVLGRAGCLRWDSFSDKSTPVDVIYCLLHGPALFAR